MHIEATIKNLTKAFGDSHMGIVQIKAPKISHTGFSVP